MSVLFLPPSAGAASVPDASETVKGKIRIATSAEATAGTDDLTSMTPAKVKSVVDAAVAGGVTYKGTFDAAAPLDLSNAVQGDLYIIDGAGTYQGKTWAVGDHLLVNADMGGTVDPAKIDKIDSTDSVTSVAGRTGAVVLSTADISGLAAVATSGAYSDLSGTPTLATVATTGAYSDLSGTPTLGTAAALDVGTSASNVVQLNGSAQLPAVDGSLLTNISATVAALDDIGDVDTTGVSTNNVLKYDGANWVDGSVAYSEVTGTPSLATVATTGAYSDLSGTPDVPVLENNYVLTTSTATAISESGHYTYWFGSSSGSSVTLTLPIQSTGVVAYLTFATLDPVDHTVTLSSGQFRLLGGVSATSISIPAGTTRSFYFYGATYFELSSNELNQIGDVTITSPSNGETLVYNSTSGDWENGTVSASVAALDDIGDVDTTGVSTNNVLKYDGANWVDGSVAYSEVTGKPSFATIATTGDYSDLNDSVVVQQFNANATASAISSNALHVFRLYGAGGFTVTLSTSTAFNGFALFNNISGSDVTVNGGTFRANGEGSSGGSTSITVKAGERRLYYVEGGTLYLESNSTLLGHNADVTITTPANGEALVYNSTSGDWENGTVSASVAALDDIGDVDTTGVSTNNVLKYDGSNWVDGSVAYSEVTGTPTLGTAAALDVGTSATNVVQLDGSARLPAVDGSQLTNLPSGGSLPTVTTQTGSYTIPSRTAGQLSLTVLVDSATPVTVDLPSIAAGDVGFTIHVKRLGAGAVTVDAGANYIDDGTSSTHIISTQYDSRTFQAGTTTDWYII